MTVQDGYRSGLDDYSKQVEKYKKIMERQDDKQRKS